MKPMTKEDFQVPRGRNAWKTEQRLQTATL